jgi:hypothetical protein
MAFNLHRYFSFDFKCEPTTALMILRATMYTNTCLERDGKAVAAILDRGLLDASARFAPHKDIAVRCQSFRRCPVGP